MRAIVPLAFVVLVASAGFARADALNCAQEIVFTNGWTESGLRAVRAACASPGTEDGKGIRLRRTESPDMPELRPQPPAAVATACPRDIADRLKEPTPPGRLDVAFTFSYGAKVDAVPPAAMASLTAFRKHLQEFYPGGRIDIVGHADRSGSDDLNDALSFRRAQNAIRIIADGDAELERHLNAIGSGSRELRPGIGPCDRAQRRIEARIPLQ